MSYRVALVRTHNHGNLGAAARAAKNFGAALVLVEPRGDREHPDALAFASGAEDVLRAAPVAATLDDVADGPALLVALTSLRGRQARGLPPAIRWPALRRERDAVLVFGPERGGLTTEEVHRCHARISLPSSPDFPTLNLAQSVAATLALLAAPARGERLDRAGAKEIDRLLDTFTSTLRDAGYPGKGHSADVIHELTSLLARARPTSREVTLLLGALAALRRR